MLSRVYRIHSKKAQEESGKQRRGLSALRAFSLMVKRPAHNRLDLSSILRGPTKGKIMEETKEGSWDAYGKVFALGHRYNRDLFNGYVEVEEKIDGSQFSFGVFGGELKCRTRKMQFHPSECTQKLFMAACETVMRLQPLLIDGWTYRGEVISKPKHNVLTYGRVPAGNIVIWDIATDKQDYLRHRLKADVCVDLGLECVPLLCAGSGQFASMEDLINELSEKTSMLGGCKIEGFVIKNNDLFGADGKRLTGKWVCDEFKEVHKSKSYGKLPKKDAIQAISEKYCTEARWAKSVQHMSEDGTLSGELKDIGPLLGAVQKDLYDECKEEIKSDLFVAFWKQIARGSTSGLVDWYKARLADDHS